MVVARRAIAGAVLLIAIPAAALLATAAKIEKHIVVSRHRDRVYYLFVPPGVSAEHPAPLIVTLHGSGRDGKTLVTQWKDLAEREGVVLAGPDSTDSQHWAAPQDGPLFLRDLVEEIQREQPIDPHRVYLFGHSAGAVFAIQMACLESEYFAAAVIHAGAIDPAYYSLFDFASRKIPIAIFIGTRDPVFPLLDVRQTAEALRSRGLPVSLTEIPGHNHDYGASSKEINAAAWAFLTSERVATPRYTAYKDP